jgi:hypothetical protein
MAVHIVYCVRADTPERRPDPNDPDAVPVCREIDGATLARGIRSDGTLPVIFDGLRVPVPLPPLAGAILTQVDGCRRVAEIAAILAQRGTRPDAFATAWQQTFTALERINRLLLAARP